jgi:hypothetical protein
MPAVASGLAVATGRTSVVGFDPSSGEILWDVPRAEGLVVPPAIDLQATPGGIVVFVEGNTPTDSKLAGIDPTSRLRVFEVELGGQSRTAPSIFGGLVFVGTRERTVKAVDLASGSEAWTAQTEGLVATSPAVDGGKVFVVSQDEQSERSRLYALGASDGRVAWTYSPPGVSLGVSSVTVADGSVFVGFGDSTLRSFDRESGALAWTAPVRAPFSSQSTPAVARGSVFALDLGGGVYRFDEQTGELVWDYQFPSLAEWGAPVVVGETVFVGLDDGTIAGIAVASGHLVWQTRLRQGPIGAFAPTGGLLLAPVIGPRGGVVAFERASDRALVDIPSPSELDLPVALVNFLAGSAAVVVALLLLFRLALPRLRGAREGSPP